MEETAIQTQIDALFQAAEEKTGGEWGIVFSDLTRNIRVVRNPDTVFASASLIKLPILVAVMMAAHEGAIDLARRLTLDNSSISEEDKEGSGVIIHLSNHLQLSVQDLCVLMVMVSDNFATNAIIDLLGMQQINCLFERLGLRHTRVNHRITDFETLRNRAVNPVTPAEIGELLEGVYFRRLPHSALIEEILQKQIYATRIPLLLPYEDDGLLVGHKTGTLSTVAHDAGIVRTRKGAYVLCMLTQSQKAVAATGLAMAELSVELYNLLASPETTADSQDGTL